MSKKNPTKFTIFELDCLNRGGFWEINVTLDFQSESIDFAHRGSQGSISLDCGD